MAQIGEATVVSGQTLLGLLGFFGHTLITFWMLLCHPSRIRINAAIRRRVGQLALDDFSAGVDLMNGTGTAANANLVPEQSWRVEGQVARTLGPAGSISIGGYHEWISDIVDQIPVSPTEEAVGNLPRARRYGLTVRGTLLLDSLGWRGARIDLHFVCVGTLGAAGEQHQPGP